jgi:parallel beta-helix repeat protein
MEAVRRRPRAGVLFFGLLGAGLALGASGARAEADAPLPTAADALAVTPTFHAAGVRLSVTGDDNGNARAELFYRPAGTSGGGPSAEWRPALPLARIDGRRFAGSLFSLTPGTEYEARVVLSDPDDESSSEMTAAFQTRAEEVLGSGGHVWHVAPNGRTGARGGETTPLKTIQQAVDRAEPGDVVLVHPGTYRETVTVRQSGTPTDYLQIRAAGPGVFLDGTDPRLEQVDTRDNWRADATGQVDPEVHPYWTTLTTGPGYVAANGERLYHYNTIEELRTRAAGVSGGWFYDSSARRLTVALPSGGDPDTIPMQVARLPHAFLLDGARCVSIEGFEISGYGLNAFGKGIFLRDASHCIVRGNRVHNVNVGIWVKGIARENLIEGNELFDTAVTGWPWERVKGTDADGTAITLAGGPGNVVRGNRLHGFFHGLVASTWDDLTNEGYNTDLDVYDNEISDVGEECLAPQGACINVRFWGNRLYNMRVGLSLAPITVGPLYAIRNSATDFREAWVRLSNGSSGPCFLYHNSAATARPDASGLLGAGPWQNLVLRNNALQVTRAPIDDPQTDGAPLPTDPASLDNDALCTSDPTRFAMLANVPYPTLAEFQVGTGQELDGLSEPPGFADPAAGDLHLLPDSPLIDRAVPLPNVSDSFLGAGPDIGVYER